MARRIENGWELVGLMRAYDSQEGVRSSVSIPATDANNWLNHAPGVRIGLMSIEHIVGLLIEERDRLEAAISALQSPSSAPEGIDEDPTMPDWVKPNAKVAPAPKKKGFSAATRRKMAEGQKRRWAAKRAAVVAESVSPIRETNSVRIEQASASKGDEEFKSKKSEAKKSSWAKRKKATISAAAKPKATPAKTPAAPKKKATAARSAAFSKKMSETMKKAWAKWKKAAKK